MIIGTKDVCKLFGISIIACSAVFVCSLFLNYNMDLAAIEDSISTQAAIAMYHAQVSMGKVTAAVTGGCLVATSVVMLLFYIKNYIDTHGKELGILKALGYSNRETAGHFWVFGLSVLAGCVVGFVAAFLYMPAFYRLQNGEGLFPEVPVNFHPLLALLLMAAPGCCFALISVLYACQKLKSPVLDLLRERREYTAGVRREESPRIGGGRAGAGQKTIGQKEAKDLSFLQELRRTTLRGKKPLVFFVGFSAFCFSAMVQMSMSMKDLSSETFAFMVITIGLILAFVTLFLSLSSVIKGNAKTIAMMRVFGYEHDACSRAILGGYRPFSYLGFAAGTVYQYVLLKLTMTFVFADIENMPRYHFDFKALAITFAAFVVTYELILRGCSLWIRKLPLKCIMLE